MSRYQEVSEIRRRRPSRHTYQPSSGGLRVDELLLEEDEEVTDQEK